MNPLKSLKRGYLNQVRVFTDCSEIHLPDTEKALRLKNNSNPVRKLKTDKS
jgi:hypothetical protein